MCLPRRVELYLRRNKMAPTRFGLEAMNDRGFVFDLRNGRELREKTKKRVTAWLDSREDRR